MSGAKSEKELQEVFERYSWVEHGRRYELGLIPEASGLRTMLERHKSSAETWLRYVREKHAPRMYPVHFDYVENLHMNAFAFVWKDHGYVGVYPGAVVTVYSFFSYLLAHPASLATIGNPSVEEEWSAFDPTRMTRVPKDPARASFAHLLATLALDFLFAHEIGHLMNGHVELLRAQGGGLVFCEFAERQFTEAQKLTSQTLEMDADSFAATQGLATMFGPVE